MEEKKKIDFEVIESKSEFQILKEKYLYALADLDNLRKRTENTRTTSYNNGVEDTILAILPVVDDFERAYKHNELAEGGQLIYKKLVSTLDNLGVMRIHIETDTDFNVDEHEAVSMTGSNNKVVEEVLAGYKHNGKVIRYSKVVVG